MKTHFLTVTALLLCKLLIAQNTPLNIVTFNSGNGTNTPVASITGLDTLYENTVAGLHPADHGAIAPEQGWFIFIGKGDSTPYKLYTISLADGHVVYSTPAWFAGNFKEYYYSDTIGKLVGIYTDTAANGQQYFASCNLQTGSISQLAPIQTTTVVTAYSHTKEMFYFIRQYYDTTLYEADPVSGHIDSVGARLTDHTNIFEQVTYIPYDMQYDDAQQQLLAFGPRRITGADDKAIVSINTANGIVTALDTLLYMYEPNFSTADLHYHFAYDEVNSRYLFPSEAIMSFPPVFTLYSISTVNGSDTSFTMYGLNGTLFQLDTMTVTDFAYDYVTQKVYGLLLPHNHPATHPIPPIPPAQTLCKVTVDSNSTHNVITWEKLDKEATDSFRIYRETATNQYTEIAAIPRDSLSEYHDFGADPNITGYRYKISVKDTNGTEGQLSPYHNTIHLQYLGGGNLIWNQYTIEGGNIPVTTFDVMIDSTGTGNWSVLINVPGTQTTTTDINFNAHPNAQYRLVANWSYNCVPTRSSFPAVFSNIISLQSSGIQEQNTWASFQLIPNPASASVTIIVDQDMIGGMLTVTDLLGRKMAAVPLPTANCLLPTDFPNGIYLVSINNSYHTGTQKLVIQH